MNVQNIYFVQDEHGNLIRVNKTDNGFEAVMPENETNQEPDSTAIPENNNDGGKDAVDSAPENKEEAEPEQSHQEDGVVEVQCDSNCGLAVILSVIAERVETLQGHNAELLAEHDGLKEENDGLRAGNDGLKKEIKALEENLGGCESDLDCCQKNPVYQIQIVPRCCD